MDPRDSRGHYSEIRWDVEVSMIQNGRSIASEVLLATQVPPSMLAKHEARVTPPSVAKTEGQWGRAGSSKNLTSTVDFESEVEATTAILTYSLTYS